MASFNIHLAIGIRYAEKNNVKNLKRFYREIVEPDLAANKNISHYTVFQDKNHLSI